MNRRVFMKSGRAGAGDDGADARASCDAPRSRRAATAPRDGARGQDADRALPARRGRRAERRRAARRAGVLRGCVRSIAIAAPGARGGRRGRDRPRRLLRTASRRSRRSSRCGIAGCSRRFTRSGVRAPRARTSTRRTTWRRGTPDNKGTRDGWLNRYLAVKGTCERLRATTRARRRSARSR